jgi:hypothetical protein
VDIKNRFETPRTLLHARAEWAIGLVVSVTFAVIHISDIRWPVFIGFFLIIDLIGYIPGAIAYRRTPGGQIGRGYYVAYNVMHSMVTNSLLVGAWMLFVGPEWALLAVPIHLLGDRALFGNSAKPFGVEFEPKTHPAFAAFEQAYQGATVTSSAGQVRVSDAVRT